MTKNPCAPSLNDTSPPLAIRGREARRLWLTISAGVVILALFFGGLGVWAAVAPLHSAAIAPGSVSVDTNQKTIKHLEGGIVAQILVQDGDVVRKGQPLVRLDVTKPRATLDLLKGRKIAASALEARLVAERDGRAEIEFSEELLDQLEDNRTIEAIAGQINIFAARREALGGQGAIQEKRIAQIAEEIHGLEKKIRAESTQLELIFEEIKDVKELVGKGLARKPRLLALEREAADIQGSRAQNAASIARANQTISETRLRIIDLRTVMVNEAVELMREVQAEQFELSERILAAEDVLRRTTIDAPLAGTIVALQIHTQGGVISPGEPLMNIVPSGDRLVIEAKLDPSDIDVVHPGLEARVQLTPYSGRNTAPISGIVTSVSADRLTDDRTGQSYYLARIELTEDIAADTPLYPGMPAEVMIATGSQTALDYIFGPITHSLDLAFREK